MTIIELLERNAREWPNDTALVEINPDQPETRRVTWHDFELVEPSTKKKHYRRNERRVLFHFVLFTALAVLLIAGGIGIPPMLQLAAELPGEKTIILGYRDNDLFLESEFSAYGKVVIATEDGSVGVSGNVLDAIRQEGITGDMICSCGPTPPTRQGSAP